MSKTKCKCISCLYCKIFHVNTLHGIRKEVFCKAPDQRSVIRYFEKYKPGEIYGFIGFVIHEVFPLKKTPKWCPIGRKWSLLEGVFYRVMGFPEVIK